MQQVLWISELPQFLGVDPSSEATKACKEQPPTALDTDTLTAYGERCGKEIALEWASNQTGVNVTGCSKAATKQVPECVANNYGITLDLYSDGKVNWDNVVRDAGAVGGIAVCAATGAGAAAAPLCGKIGAKVAQVFNDVGKAIGGAIIDFFWGGDDGGGIACEQQPFPGVPAQEAVRDIARFLKYGAQNFGTYPAAVTSLGPIVKPSPGQPSTANKIYWDRLIKMRGMATATASIAADIGRQTGASPAAAIKALAPVAPPGWTELARPTFKAMQAWPANSEPLSYFPDYIMTAGGLFAVLTDPRMLEVVDPRPAGYWTKLGVKPPPTLITARWQQPSFWSGVPQPPQSTLVWRYFSVVWACPNHAIVWGDVEGIDFTKKILTAKASPSNFDYWIYSVPKDVEQFLIYSTDASFDQALKLWRESITTGLEKKVAAARAMTGGGRRRGVPGIVLLGGLAAAGAAAWFLL